MKTHDKFNEELFNELSFEALQEDNDYDVFDDFSINQNKFLDENLTYIKKLNFKAKVELGKLKNVKAQDLLKKKVRSIIDEGTEDFKQRIISLIQVANPKFQFRKLESLDKDDLAEILEDIDFLHAIEEIEDEL